MDSRQKGETDELHRLQVESPSGRKEKVTSRSAFLQQMDEVVPWDMLARMDVGGQVFQEEAGFNAEQGLRIFFLQYWFGLSDESMIESMQDSISIRRFLGLHNGCATPTSVAALKEFRLWLEQRDMGERLLDAIARHLHARGIAVTPGMTREPHAEIQLPLHC